MKINDLKERKASLHRVARYMLIAELVLAFLVLFAYANYLAFLSDSLLEIFLVGFTDTFLVLFTLGIATSD
jgi:hypothetical protein